MPSTMKLLFGQSWYLKFKQDIVDNLNIQHFIEKGFYDTYIHSSTLLYQTNPITGFDSTCLNNNTHGWFHLGLTH